MCRCNPPPIHRIAVLQPYYGLASSAPTQAALSAALSAMLAGDGPDLAATLSRAVDVRHVTPDGIETVRTVALFGLSTMADLSSAAATALSLAEVTSITDIDGLCHRACRTGWPVTPHTLPLQASQSRSLLLSHLVRNCRCRAPCLLLRLPPRSPRSGSPGSSDLATAGTARRA